MCSPRILCRLRLDRNATKRSIQDLLKEAIFSIQRITFQKLHSKDLSFTSSLFTSEAKKVIQLVDRWLKHRTLDELGDLVEGIHHLQQTTPRFYNLLDLVSNNDMDPSSRSSLLNIITKVSRYWGAARKLYRSAKKFPLVRHMKVQLANLPRKAFTNHTNSSEISDLCSCLSKLGLVKGQQQSLSQLCGNLRLDQKAARARYEGARKALSAPKIHAEIQIIAFCELQAPILFPRVVSSSKDACFLCNTFIQLYERMHTPKTHGRLYPGWRLPSLPQFRALYQKLNRNLIQNLQQNVSLGLAQRKLPIRPLPNESTLLTLSASGTTVNMPELVSETSEGKIPSTHSTIVLSDDSPKHCPSLTVSRLSSTVSPSDHSNKTVHLREGGLVNDFVKHNSPFHIISTESLEVHLGLEVNVASLTRKKSLGYGIKRVASNRNNGLSQTCPVIDVRQLEGEVLFPLTEDNAFCLVTGDVVLKISIHGWSADE